jgi:CheY-like chemotaxis protein
MAIRAVSGDDWTPFVASSDQILMTWERWRALQKAALIDHPWPVEAVRRAVELLPEGTRRLLPQEAIGARCAFVVDASKAMHVIATTLLNIAGFSVETFDTPAAALRRAVDRRPDIIVMEPRSPGIDARSTMRTLRELHGDQAAPVVWCTTVVPTLEHISEGARLGLRGVILKPLRLEALRALVLRVCRDAQRETRLLALGVPADHLASRSLDRAETRLWAQVELEMVADPPHELSAVRVGGDSPDVMSAIRACIRAGDMVGRASDRSLLVLLPDVGEAGAASVAGRITRAVSAMVRPPDVDCVTGGWGTSLDGHDHLAAGLARLHHPMSLDDLLEAEHPDGPGPVGPRLGLGDHLAQRDVGERVPVITEVEAAEEAELHPARHVGDRVELLDRA